MPAYPLGDPLRRLRVLLGDDPLTLDEALGYGLIGPGQHEVLGALAEHLGVPHRVHGDGDCGAALDVPLPHPRLGSLRVGVRGEHLLVRARVPSGQPALLRLGPGPAPRVLELARPDLFEELDRLLRRTRQTLD